MTLKRIGKSRLKRIVGKLFHGKAQESRQSPFGFIDIRLRPFCVVRKKKVYGRRGRREVWKWMHIGLPRLLEQSLMIRRDPNAFPVECTKEMLRTVRIVGELRGSDDLLFRRIIS